ncbi:hypothetical protein L579_0448 [Pantoea sp. AS-PWVM4]|nr:hypothetical protein L579_0448 [Pantoea sp. AS-PWVM4]
MNSAKHSEKSRKVAKFAAVKRLHSAQKVKLMHRLLRGTGTLPAAGDR